MSVAARDAAMVQLRPRASRVPGPAAAMVDEDQPASEEEEEEEAGHGLLLGQPSSGAAAEPLEEDEDELDDDEAPPEEVTFACAQVEAREEERRVRDTVRRFEAAPGPAPAVGGPSCTAPPHAHWALGLSFFDPRDKALLKEKRKRREELFIEQKVRE